MHGTARQRAKNEVFSSSIGFETFVQLPPGLLSKLNSITSKDLRDAEHELTSRREFWENYSRRYLFLGPCSERLKRLVAYASRRARTLSEEAKKEAAELVTFATKLCETEHSYIASQSGEFLITKNWYLVFIHTLSK